MDSIWAVARAWNYVGVQTRREESDLAARRFNAAISAEDQLATHVRTALGYDGIRMRLRVPRTKEQKEQMQEEAGGNTRGSRGEIDMVVLTSKHLFVVEVKNWVGDVYTSGANDDQWIQCPPHPVNPRAHGNPINHGPVLDDHREKSRALITYMMKSSLAQASGLQLPLGFIVPLLVFTNDKVILDRKTQQRHPHAMTLSEFSQVVGSKVVWWDWAAWMCPWAVPSTELTYNQQLIALEVIDTLPTWDVVTLHNGTVRTGDVLRFFVPEASRRAQQERRQQQQQQQQQQQGGGGGGGAPIQVPVIQRQNVSSARVTWPGTGTLGLVWTVVVGNDRPGLTLTMRPGAEVPGELAACGWLIRGASAAQAAASTSGAVGSPMSRRRVGGGNEQPSTVVRIPIGHKLAEPIQSQQVCHLEFRPAGKTETEKIALHHIASVELSAMHHYMDRGAAQRTPTRGAAAAAAAANE
jgi:hypothetical protein